MGNARWDAFRKVAGVYLPGVFPLLVAMLATVSFTADQRSYYLFWIAVLFAAWTFGFAQRPKPIREGRLNRGRRLDR